MIQIDNVSVSFENLTVLKDISLTLNEKKIGIIGSNGGGKSTFARLLNGLQMPSNGFVIIDALDTRTNGKAVRRKVGFVFQNPENQIVFPIVEEDIAFGLKNLGYDKTKINDTVDAILMRYGLMHLRQHKSHLLSGGEKQLLAISGVLAMEPEYVVFDEPTTLLDLKNKQKIFHLIANLSQTVVVVTHDLDLIENFDRVICFDQGRVVYDDVPSIVINQYKALVKHNE